MKNFNNKLIGFFGKVWVNYAIFFLSLLSIASFVVLYSRTFFDNVVTVLITLDLYTSLVVYIRKKKAEILIKKFREVE